MLTVVLLCLLLCVVYAVSKQIKWRRSYKLPPSMPGELPIIGHTLLFVKDGAKDLWTLLKSIADEALETEGGTVHLWLLQDLYFFITDPDDAIVVANSCLEKHYVYSFAKKWLGQGLVTATAEINKQHRKLLGSQFKPPAVQTFLHIFNDNARELVKEIDPFSGKPNFDPSHIIKHSILKSACLTTFGPNIKDVDFFKQYSTTLHELIELYIKKFTKVYLHYNPLFKLMGYQKKEEQLVSIITKLTNKVIQDMKAEVKNNNIHEDKSDLIGSPAAETTHTSLVDHLIELQGSLTDEEIKEEINTNIFASYDTVAHTLINMMLLLGSYPNVQDKIYEELKSVLGPDRDVEKNDLQNLVFTKAVIKESLRVVPTVPIFGRYTDKEVKLKNYIIPANSHCGVMTYGIHRSSAWGPDADQFRPERWLDSVSLPSNPNYFTGFSIGKRSCIGMTHAITQLTVILAHLVRQFKWTSDFSKVKMQFYIVLQPVEGVAISLERRTACM